MKRQSDYIILGAGIFGLYAAKLLTGKGHSVTVLELDSAPFARASYVNQARIHMGYHYPRSFTTAFKAASYFDRFSRDFAFAVNSRFKKVYGIARRHSLTSGQQFQRFCRNAQIPCTEVETGNYFQPHLVEAAFATQEYTFDAAKIRDWFVEELAQTPLCQLVCAARIQGVDVSGNQYTLSTNYGEICASTVVNATYASVNQVLDLFGHGLFEIKYEISEIILCDVADKLKDVGLTLMDGPFFSIMPFGHQGCHSLTSVTFTHHKTSLDPLPAFPCQERNQSCTSRSLENCNSCPARPGTAWTSMSQLARKYLLPDPELTYRQSLFAIKPILQAASRDDSRPTLIQEHCSSPRLISVLSGKINTIYDLDEVLP